MIHETGRVEAIRQQIHTSYSDFMRLIDGPLAELDPKKLYVSPAQGEWSIMQNLAHVAEVMPYWGNEIAKVVRAPGQKFGRTAEDPARVRAVEEHGSDTLEQAKAALPPSYEQLDEVLTSLRDSDLELKAVHPKYGEHTLDWFIDEFITRHLAAHVKQIQACTEAL